MDCDHSCFSFVSGRKSCSLCGELLPEDEICDISYNSNICVDPLVKIQSKRGISKELNLFNFSPSLEDEITFNFQQVTRHKLYRKENRLGVISATIFYTLLSCEEGEKLTLPEIARTLSCSTKKTTSGNVVFCTHLPEKVRIITASDLIPRYLNAFNLKSYSDRVVHFSIWAQFRKDAFVKTYPQVFAAACVFSFMSKIPKASGKIDCEKLSALCDREWNCIQKVSSLLLPLIVVIP